MQTAQLHRGRLIDHIHLVVNDIEKSYEFYSAIFKSLNIPIGEKADDYFWYDELFVSSKDSKSALGKLTGRVHLAFQAADRNAVEQFYKVGLAAGGKDNGKPGERDYHPGYFGAFLLDPDGNNIEGVYHGESRRSSSSVKIDFEH